MTTYKKIIVPTLENRFLDKCNDFFGFVVHYRHFLCDKAMAVVPTEKHPAINPAANGGTGLPSDATTGRSDGVSSAEPYEAYRWPGANGYRRLHNHLAGQDRARVLKGCRAPRLSAPHHRAC